MTYSISTQLRTSTAPRRPLFTNNQGARDTSYNPVNHDRMKHVARRHYFVRDMVEDFQIRVPFVCTTDNIADFFTKAAKSAHRVSGSRSQDHYE